MSDSDSTQKIEQLVEQFGEHFDGFVIVATKENPDGESAGFFLRHHRGGRFEAIGLMRQGEALILSEFGCPHEPPQQPPMAG